MRHTSFAALAALCLSGATFPVGAETINVTIASGHPQGVRFIRLLDEAYIPAVAEELGGTGTSVNWSTQYGGALAPLGGVLEAVETGLAEMGMVLSLFEPAKLGPQNVTYYTPFVSADARLIAEFMDELQTSDDGLRALWEENGLTYLGAPVGVDDYILMSTGPIESFEDLDGLKVAAPGAAVTWLEGTGATPVAGNLGTYYNEIANGVYDAVIIPASAALPARIHEVAPYILRANLGAQYAGGLAANTVWFEAQPVEAQNALRAAADVHREAYLTELETALEDIFATMAAEGATISEPDEGFRVAWAAAMPNAAAVWAQSLDEAGQPGTAFLTTYMETMREAGAEPLRAWDEE